jgi:hypothetical protein
MKKSNRPSPVEPSIEPAPELIELAPEAIEPASDLVDMPGGVQHIEGTEIVVGGPSQQ